MHIHTHSQMCPTHNNHNPQPPQQPQPPHTVVSAHFVCPFGGAFAWNTSGCHVHVRPRWGGVSFVSETPHGTSHACVFASRAPEYCQRKWSKVAMRWKFRSYGARPEALVCASETHVLGLRAGLVVSQTVDKVVAVPTIDFGSALWH